MNFTEIRGGYWASPEDSHVSRWQIESQRLDHDSYFIPLICQRFLRPGMTVIDAGAFNGDHAIAYSEAVGKDGLVIAIEPGDVAFTMLQHNAGLFPLHNVEACKVALGRERGIGRHSVFDANLGRAIFYPGHVEGDGGLKGYVIQTTLNEMRSSMTRKIDFIKMDIEGGEVAALEGASWVLEHDRPVMVIEVNRIQLAKFQAIPGDIFGLLAKHRYKWDFIQPGMKEDSEQYDIVCRPLS